MTDLSNRTLIDDDAEESLMRLFESTQNIQRRAFLWGRRGFLTQTAVAELQHNAAAIARDVSDLADKVGIAPLETRI